MPPFVVTPVYDLLLKGTADMPIGLYHLHMATAEQLCRLHYSMGSLTTIKARLKTLADNGYIQHDIIPTKQKEAPYYYALDKKGIRYLREAGLDTNEAFRASKEVNKHALFVEHTLELNDVLIACAGINRVAPRYCLDSFIHERTLKRNPYKAVWKAKGRIQAFALIPDAFLDLRMSRPDGRQLSLPVLLEHDRGTEEQKFFRRRIRAYLAFLKAEGYKQHFGVKAITVAFTTFAGESRLKQKLEWTRQELAENKDLSQTFLFSCLRVPLEPHQVLLEPWWYTPASSQAVSLV